MKLMLVAAVSLIAILAPFVKSDECSESCTLMFCCEDLKNCDGHPTISMLNNFYYLTFEGLSGRGDIWFPTERTYDGLAAAIHACGCDPDLCFGICEEDREVGSPPRE